ncbi:MAG: hypothetical protein AAGA56_02780 [Myxococcota bacterium]
MPESEETPARPYVIQPGDTLRRVAMLHDLDPTSIWGHEKNAELAEERDPEMLAPGEILFIPEPEDPTLTVTAETSNQFSAETPTIRVYIKFEGEEGPLKEEAYVVNGIGEDPIEGTLDDEGLLDITVPLLLRYFHIEFPERDITHEVAVGFLDPVDVPSGRRARLLHLGHLPVGRDVRDPHVFATRESEQRSTASFQEAHGLEPTGFLDEATGEWLVRRHGI